MSFPFGGEKSVTEPKKSEEPKKISKKTLTIIEMILAEIQAILAAHDHQESNIPLSHKYWELQNKHRQLLNEAKEAKEVK
jgi:hypothetical protein